MLYGERGRNAATASLAMLLVLLMVVRPEAAFEAAVRGLKIWWEVVFPALLPFFVGGQVLMGLGAVRAFGVLMEPAMRPLFNVPGVGAFVIAMGLASGYPIGAVLTSQLRRQEQLSRSEAERLVSFANTADPLFMAGAVAVGMFGHAGLAGLVMAAHYLSALMTGVCLRFWDPGGEITVEAVRTGNILRRAWETLHRARREDGRPFGRVLGDSVQDSANTLMLVGGFIILLSVVIRILEEVGFLQVLNSLFVLLLSPLAVDPDAASTLSRGLFEISLGTQAASQADAPLLHRLLAASAIIAWSGISVHAQVAAIMQGTGIRLAPYLAARLLHAVLAACLTVLLWNPAVQALKPVEAWTGSLIPAAPLHPLSILAASTCLFLLILAGMAATGTAGAAGHWIIRRASR